MKNPRSSESQRHAGRLLGKPLAWVSLCLFSLAAGCQFSVLTPDRFLTFDFKGSRAIVTHSGSNRTVEMATFMGAATNFTFKVLTATRSGDLMYSVIEAAGDSPAATNGACAGGVERNIIWLKFDSALTVLDSKSVLVESCVQGLHSANGSQMEKGNLTVQFTGGISRQDGSAVNSTPVEYSLSFLDAHPEKGLVVTTNFPAGNP